MKQIKLTQGQYALVDDADYDWLNQYKWYAHNRGGNFYATRMSTIKNKCRYAIHMHRQILELEPNDSRIGDHRNRDTLDNRRNNLRICTKQQNTMNRKPDINTTSHFKGVSWHKRDKKWYVEIGIKSKSKYLGSFATEEEAARAYNEAAKKYHREYAYINQI